ncbi:sugar nucleotide-binding protein [Congregibacter sp.]|uniref:sugar nucleotide-binding protein n=1 Tax=Congregibacter sp. TaxID=2744308 RepID=UPI003F6BF893
MDVLLIGADNPVGMALQVVFAQWGRHRGLAVNTASARWRSERQAKKAARKDKPQAVVDLRLAWQVSTGEIPQPIDIERAHWLSKACEHSAIPYLLLSSDRVFAGQGTRSLREFDAPDAFDEPGFQIMETETRVIQAAPSAIVLRTGPLFASTDSNFLTRMLSRMSGERHATFDDQNVFTPVACADVARVLAAMLDQLSVGADARGVYHYSSGDRTTKYAFAEAALAAMSQYRDCGDIVISAKDKRPDESAETRFFDCSRLRDTFAIKQVPWRGFINATVRDYAESKNTKEVA